MVVSLTLSSLHSLARRQDEVKTVGDGQECSGWPAVSHWRRCALEALHGTWDCFSGGPTPWLALLTRRLPA